MSYLDPTNSVAFHKIFANTKRTDVLPAFLNAVLRPKSPIISVRIENPYQESRLADLKETVVDVRAKDEMGVEYIVEMQVENEPGWAKRAAYYTSNAVVGQIEKGEPYDKLQPVFFIGVLDFKFDGTKPEAPWFSRYQLWDKNTSTAYPYDFQLNFIELPRFKKELTEITDDLEAWAWFFIHTHELTQPPVELTSRPGLSSALAEANAQTWSRPELNSYERSRHAEIGRQLREEWLQAEAEARGEASGRAKGELAERRRNAHAMLAAGMTEAGVAGVLGLDLEALRALLATD